MKMANEDPKKAEGYFALGMQYKSTKQFFEAENAFKNSLRIDENQEEPLLNLAIVQQKQGKLDVAMGNYNLVLKKNKSSAMAYFGLGFCYFNKNQLDFSAKNFEKAIEHNVKFLDAHINLGAIKEKQGKFIEAMEHYKTALEIKPKSARAYRNLAVIHEKTGAPEIAIKCYEMAIKFNYKDKEELKLRVEKIKAFLSGQEKNSTLSS
jgi:protein O-GlcNAc transferase